MKFTVATKPFSDSLNLGIIPSNISKFYQKSCIAKLTMSETELRVNLEVAKICTELVLTGKGDMSSSAGESPEIFVDSALLRQLVSTFDTPTTDIEFLENGIILHSGAGKYNLAKTADATAYDLKRPDMSSMSEAVPVNADNWKFISDNQMYAVAMSFVHPVYRNVWIGESGDVLVGDYDHSLFTWSEKGDLPSTCLVSDTVVNLITSLPEGAQIYRAGESYVVQLTTDGFIYFTQFDPDYESNPEVGSYNSDIILTLMDKSDEHSVAVDSKTLNKYMSQADLLSHDSEDTITLLSEGGKIYIRDDKIDGQIPADKPCDMDYSVEFRTRILKMLIRHLDSDAVHIKPRIDEDGVVGMIFYTDNMVVVLGGVE